MRKIALYLYVNGRSPVESEKLMIQKRKRITRALSLRRREREELVSRKRVDFS